MVDLSDAAGSPFDRDELAFDAYYRIAVREGVMVQPEVQWILDPSGAQDVGDVLVLGLRVGVDF